MTVNPPTITPEKQANDIFDYKGFREEHREPLGDLWDENLSLANNLMAIIKESVVLPYADIQLPVLVAYTLIPSAIASIVPLLCLQGDKGSGKSTVGIIISGVHNSPITSAATTFAALRNDFNRMRWHFPDVCEGEKNCCLIFDNVNKETLANEQLYTMLLNGYNRKTDTISISKGNGENMDFKVFGLKVMSSIHPFYTQSKFAELARRCLVIKCKPFDKMTLAEKESLGLDENYNIVEKLDVENLDLSILRRAFTQFWEDTDNLLEYTTVKRKLTARKKSFRIPEVIDGSKWTISIDLITTGIVTEIWDSIPTAIDAMAKYWEWYNLHVASAFGATHKVLKDFIEHETAIADKINAELKYEAAPREINTEKLKKHISWASSQGMLDISPTPSVIADVMADLGWRLDRGTHGQICWIPALN